MPTMPVLGITSRSDPKTRYARRNVKEVAAQSIKTNFPWKSYSKQTSPSPDRDGMIQNGESMGEDRPRMFPSQDDKTNAFMDSLAQRINYMTGKIASMGNTSSDRRPETSTNDAENGDITRTNNSTGNTIDKDELQDSGLSSHEGSHQPSELTTPDNDGSTILSPTTRPGREEGPPKSPASPKSPSSPLKGGDARLDAEADACLIEESHRGFSILKALQERRRRSMVLEDQPDEVLTAAASTDHLRFVTGSSPGGTDAHPEVTTPPTKKAEIISTV